MLAWMYLAWKWHPCDISNYYTKSTHQVNISFSRTSKYCKMDSTHGDLNLIKHSVGYLPGDWIHSKEGRWYIYPHIVHTSSPDQLNWSGWMTSYIRIRSWNRKSNCILKNSTRCICAIDALGQSNFCLKICTRYVFAWINFEITWCERKSAWNTCTCTLPTLFNIVRARRTIGRCTDAGCW